INATWAVSGSNVSAAIVGDGNASHFLNGQGGWTVPTGTGGLPCSGTCTANTLPKFGASGASVTNSLADDGLTTANTFTYSGTGGIATSGPLKSANPSGGVGSSLL